MTFDDAIINPVRTPNAPALGPTAVLTATRLDLHRVCSQMGLNRDDFRRIYLSRLYNAETAGNGFAVAGPVIGAPYAVMVLEALAAWGARRIVFLGWCGAISKQVSTGDIIIATGALIGEGTSGYYRDPAESDPVALPAAGLVNEIRQGFSSLEKPPHEGIIWSTDALFRETRPQVTKLAAQGVLAVEMELSALFTAGRFRRIDVAGVLVVSDELSSLDWKPGFKTESLKQGRRKAIEGIVNICRNL